MLSDEPRMRNFIGEHLALGIRLRLQHEVINAAGDGDNMKGIVHWTNILTHRSGADSAMPFDVLHKAVTAIRVSTYGMYEPNYVLMNPYDFELAMLAKDGNDTYYYGGPARESMPKIWGLTPIMHSEVTEGAPIVLDSRACELYVREDVSLAVSDSHDTHFTSGIVDFLASGRWGFAVLQPSAVCEVLAFDS
jgi:HK97 family phage major capsid protein